MEAASLRAGVDANVLIASVLVPRWPFEVMLAARRRAFHLVLVDQVIDEARRNLRRPVEAHALDELLAATVHESLRTPPEEEVQRNLHLVRSAKDVPIALALIAADVPFFVTNDRDFTDPEATSPAFRARVRALLPAVFLRDVLGWRSDELERVRSRGWSELTG